MRTRWFLAAIVLFGAACAQTHRYAAPSGSGSLPAAEWSMNATIIEACSCPMFCQCYFNTQPASHPGCCPPGTDASEAPRYCRFNNAFRVNHGTFNGTRLDGAKFWVAGDLGSGWEDGTMDWARLHFDPKVTPEQREGIAAVLGTVYAVKWGSFEVGEDLPIEWKADKDRAVAKLEGGKAGEVVLERFPGMTDEPIVIHNLRYWGAPRNDGFVLMPNTIEAYRLGAKPYEFRGTNGFMITFDVKSSDPPPASPGY